MPMPSADLVGLYLVIVIVVAFSKIGLPLASSFGGGSMGVPLNAT